ncbi:MAG: phosphoribosylanthranilate isomerase [Kofleriaceae bacterium]
MTAIKICGVTLADDAARVAAAGVEYIGLNFWTKSRRYLEPARAPMIAAAARAAGAIQIVGVFVDSDLDEVKQIATVVSLDVIQLHGDEDLDDVAEITAATKRPVWKSLAMGAPRDVDGIEAWPTEHVEHVLLDAPSAGKGGSGKTFDWTLAIDAHRRYPARRFLLAGGLDPGNVAQAIATVSPWGVDVASGVEAGPGIKDPDKIAAFVAAVRGV